MFFPDKIRLLYIIAALILVIVLIVNCIILSRRTFRLKMQVINPMVIGIFSIIPYCLFLLSNDYKLATLFESLYFIGTDWLAMFMMYFAIYYTEQDDRKTGVVKTVFAFFVIVDTISLFLNNYKFHMFRIIPLEGRFGIGTYWGNDFYFLHYCHLLLCYVMVGISLGCLIVTMIKINSVYKPKYYTVLIAYIVVIIANCISYNLNLPIDFSVVLYGVLGGFISYYAVSGFPKRLLDVSLLMVNDTISDAVIYFDYFGHCVYANKNAKLLFSNEGDFIPELTETYRERWAEQIASNERSLTGTDSFYEDGKESYFEVIYQREYYKDSEIGSSLKLYDKTEEVRRYEEERELAIHDPLTGIYNRIGFFETVDATVEKYGNDGWLMLSSNIRDFQLINEYFGEQRGDEVLKRQAEMCKTYSHESTVYGRIADDKLALYTRIEYFDKNRFLNFISKMAELTDCPYYKMRVQIGIYEPNGTKETAQVMYDKAILAAQLNASEYDKIFSYYDSDLMGKIFSDKRLSASLESALENREVEMYLQPIMNKKGECVGAEALSRWRNPRLGDMLPEQFIEILEKTGKIYLLDSYIWEKAAKLLQMWKVQGKDKHFISVNISIKDFFYTDLYKTFVNLVEKYNINPQNLRVEITETVLMSDFVKVYSLAENLRKAGFMVAIDNFGNGYSSLNMLKDFKADCIKIDIALIRDAATEERSQIILKTIVEMAKSLGMDVVGNGVETKEQYDFLKKSKCQSFQGNYISQPISVTEFELKYNN